MGINLHYGAGQKWTLPQNWMVFKTGFDKDEIKKILKDIEDVPFVAGTTFGENIASSVNKFAWIYEKILGMCENANNELWGFNIHALPEMMQYTEYDAKDKGHYDWHQDIGPDIGSLRKISITVQLSDNDEYEGGHLEYYSGGPMEGPFFRAHRGVGTTFCFPSYMLHRVTPVTKGKRKSLVLWIGGSSYK